MTDDEDHALSPEAKFRHWRDDIAGIFDVRPLDHDYRDTFYGEISRYNLGGALLGQVETSAQQYARTESLIGSVGVDHLLVQLYESGRTTLDIDGTEVNVGRNDVVVIDLARPLASHATEMRAINLVVPRALLHLDATALDRAHGVVLSGGDPFGRLAGDHLRSLMRAAPDLPPEGSGQLVGASAAILSACLAPNLLRDQEAPAALTASVAMVRRFIDSRLGDPDLGPALLMRQVGLSRSALYRLFEPLGGVAEYIRKRRLERANLMLNAETVTRGGVGVIARRLGFPSEDAFSRAFKQRFGLSPRDAARARGKPLPDPVDGDGSLVTWLRHLGV